MRIGLPGGGHLAHDPVDLRLGADVDAARGLGEDEDVRLAAAASGR